MPVPIKQIAENEIGLSIVENTYLAEELSIFGLLILEDCRIYGKNRKVLINEAKRRTVYIDPRIYYERTLGTVNSTIAHECYHWHRHQPYHMLMKAIGHNSKLGKNIKCAIETNKRDSKKWNAEEWLEWQANGIAMRILMPSNTAKIKINSLFNKYNFKEYEEENLEKLELIIDELSQFYGISKQAVKIRMKELGYSIVDGVYTYVNGRYIPNYTFKADSIGKNETFIIPAADLFKAYYFNNDLRKIIDSGNVVYINGFLCINHSKYIYQDKNGTAFMTDYALANIDECCLVFKKGYTYESVYYNQKNYSYFLAKAEKQPSSVEFSFEMNAHNSSLLNQIQSAKKKADAMRRYPGSFAETLVMLMEERKMTNKKLADVSLVGERTIQRLRNEEEYPTSIQSILGLCVGLKLPVPEAEMLLDKSDFKLNSMKEEGYIYKCILGACAVNSIYEINEMLEANNVKPLGSDSYA